MKSAGLLLAALLPATCESSHAADTGDEVIVVYNSRMPESKGVADYYAQKRNVPKDQVFGFDLTTNVDMTRAEFRDALQKPLATILEDNKLWHVSASLIRATNGQPGRVEWMPGEPRSATRCCVMGFRRASCGTPACMSRSKRKCGRNSAGTRRPWIPN